MKRFFNTVKELILERKFMILILGGVIGLLSFFIVGMIGDLDLESIEDIFSAFPEGFLEFFGDLEVIANPYGFWNTGIGRLIKQEKPLKEVDRSIKWEIYTMPCSENLGQVESHILVVGIKEDDERDRVKIDHIYIN